MILAPDALLRLLTWLSPAFPTGGFAYSHGLEWAVEAGDVHDGATLAGWLDGLIRWGSIRSDATLLRHAHRAGDLAALLAVTELATACAPARERQLESLAQGAAFCAAAAPWPSDSLGSLRQSHGEAIPYPVAVGVLASSYGIEEDPTCLAFLHAVCANMISAGVRLIPLGQAAGLRVLASLEPALKDLAVMSAGLTLGEIGGASLRPDIAAMRHETQYTRLFRS